VKAFYYELETPGALRQVETTLDPAGLGPTEVLAETEYTVVSPGTELAAWEGKPPLRPSKAYPRLMGYCNLARVVAAGRAVERVRTGDCILTNQSHRSAFVCPESRVLLRLTAAPDNRSRRRLAATYLYQLGYAALQAGNYVPGTQVGIVGMGTLGLTVASLVQAGSGQPWMFTQQDRSALAKAIPDAQVHSKDAPPQWPEPLAGLGGLDLVINTSNRWPDHLLSMKLARKGGLIVFLGFPGRGEAPPNFNPLDSQYLYDKQLTLRHCGHVTEADLPAVDARFTLPRNLQYLADLISRNVLDPDQILSFEAPATDLAGVYHRLLRHEPGVYTALLRWREK
jgi:threonine dehydrogenase-like Zn-dependent dehydrogenase